MTFKDQDYSHRIRKLSIFIALLIICFGTGLAYQMLVQQEPLSRRMFIDQKRLMVIQDLAAEGIIIPLAEGVQIDEKKLDEKFSSQSLKQFVLNRQAYMSFEDGTFLMEPSALSVSNRRLIQKKLEVGRGRIFDRNGQVLAYNETDKKGLIKRVYPSGPAFFPVIGVSHPVYGQKGLERELDQYLRGRVQQGMFTSIFRFLSGKEKNCDVVLTLDKTLQETAFTALDNRAGAVVVLDVHTGEILAAASAPSFDPDTPTGIAWDQAVRLKSQGPFVNRAFEKRYPPGSTYKMVVATALLEKKGFDLSWGVDCKGRHPKYGIREHKNKHHGWMGLKNAISLSCNVFFAEAGVKLGPDLLKISHDYGFNSGADIFMNGSNMVLASRAFSGVMAVNEGRAWEEIDFQRNPRLVAQGAVGQNVVEATPFQMARVGAAIGNDGKLMRSGLIQHIKFSKKGDNQAGWYNLKSFASKTDSQVMSKKTSRLLLDMMKGVTDKGTGYSLEKIYREDGLYKKAWNLPKDADNLFAGKTGTAETGQQTDDHSWFLAIAPVDRPQYAIAVIIENGGYGSKSAGPVAVDVMLTALNLNVEKPDIKKNE